jgi:hypothetical protein
MLRVLKTGMGKIISMMPGKPIKTVEKMRMSRLEKCAVFKIILKYQFKE